MLVINVQKALINFVLHAYTREVVNMDSQKVSFRKLANFRVPRVGAPNNRKGGAIRALKITKNREGELK